MSKKEQTIKKKPKPAPSKSYQLPQKPVPSNYGYHVRRGEKPTKA